MKRNKGINKVFDPLVRVIRDPRDGRLDYFIPRKRAKQLYEDHKLFWDLNNLCYLASNGDRF